MYVNDVTKHEGTERKQCLLHEALTETIESLCHEDKTLNPIVHAVVMQ